MVERADVEAALQARHELGREYEGDIADSLAAKIERRLEERARERRPAPRSSHGDPRVLLGSIALGIPITAIALSNSPGAGGVIVAIIAWIAIAVANIAWSQRR